MWELQRLRVGCRGRIREVVVGCSEGGGGEKGEGG